MMPLLFAGKGEQRKIEMVRGSAEVRKHLADLGFVSGSDVTVVTEAAGNLIVNVREARVAIGREMAARIMVLA